MTVMNEIRKECNYTTTENGDTAYRSTFNKNLDFFGTAAAMRWNRDDLIRSFEDACDEDVKIALMNAFYLRDIRKGCGERESFRACLRILHGVLSYEQFTALIPYVINYGRYDDLLVFLEFDDTKEMISRCFWSQLGLDEVNKKAGKPYSLCAKWMPSVNTSSSKTKKMAKEICKYAGVSEMEYRKRLSYLRNGMIVEKNLTERDYTYDYAKLPAKALSKYTAAFARNDNERYVAYKESLKKGENVAKTDTLYPYEILRMLKKDEDLANEQWKAIPRNTDAGNTIVVRDGSNSMTYSGDGMPYDVATSLAILFSEQLTGEFKNKFITFSSEPEFVELKDEWSFAKKAHYCERYDDISHTDITKVYDVLFNASKKVSNPKDYIQRVVIISDMEFDEGTEHVPTYESMKEKFDEAGIPLPEIIYWNVDARRLHFAADSEQPNVRFVSGFSKNTIDAIINNEAIDALDFMNKTLAPYEKAAEDILSE